MSNVTRAEINVRKIESFVIEGGNITIKLTSGRVLIWPSARKKCITVLPGGGIVNDLQTDFTEMSGVELDGVKLAGYSSCMACGALLKDGTVCNCQRNSDDA